jgi:hypothetical protein
VPELDGIRGPAVLLVLALHGFACSMQEDNWTGFPRAMDLLARPGGLAFSPSCNRVRSQFVEDQKSSIKSLSSHPGGTGGFE